MPYEVRERDGFAVVIDSSGKSIVDIVSQLDDAMGCNVLTPVFAPDMAERVARLLNLDAQPGDIEDRFERYREALGMTGKKPTMTLNEVRAAEDLPPIAP